MTVAQPVPGLHRNPVYDGYFADPFVWHHEGIFYAIGTGEREAAGTPSERVFPLLKSEDFFHWEPAGRALIRLGSNFGNAYWAPAVAFNEGRFFLYYSVGHEDKNHQLRAAVSVEPTGPYQDIGAPLLDPERCTFAIDPHPYQDVDGRWYMAYAKDFLDCSPHARVGTALMLTPMRSMTELQNEGAPILRARSDWQRFQANRPMYGGMWDWHTLEGACLWRHERRYYCFYSGGRWENETYGVDYGVADQITGPYSDAGNEQGPRVLRTVPGKLIGPGHNTIIRGPDGRDYIVYHAWNLQMTTRKMCITPLEWTPKGPRAPLQPEQAPAVSLSR